MDNGPQENKLGINKTILQTGIVGEYDIDNNDVVRFIVENAGGTNSFKIRMKLKGQLQWIEIGTLSGNTNEVIKSDTYDLMQVECETLDGSNVKLIASGFIDG